VISCSDGGGGQWLADKFVHINAEQEWHYPYEALSDGSVAVSGADYYKIATSLVFMGGYEEVWFYDTLPPSGFPAGVATILTSPQILTEAERQSMVADWVHRSSCRLGLGDGIGIIFVTPDKALADKLVAIIGLEDIDTEDQT
jgi:hypothetical protein